MSHQLSTSEVREMQDILRLIEARTIARELDGKSYAIEAHDFALLLQYARIALKIAERKLLPEVPL